MALSFNLSSFSSHHSLRSISSTAYSHTLSRGTINVVGASRQTSKVQWSIGSLWGRLSPLSPFPPLAQQSWTASAFARSSTAASTNDFEEREIMVDANSENSFFSDILTSLVAAIRELTPLKAVKWTTYLALISMSVRWICNTFVFNPTAWMFGSWVLVMWPWPAAVLLGLLALSASWKHYRGKASKFEQFLILTGSLVWMILVPLAHIHGFVDGWPLTLFFVYAFFYLINPIVRARLYDDLTPPPEFKEWDIRPTRSEQIAFAVTVVASHWLAALEAPPIFYSWNWQWQSRLAAGLIFLAVVLQWSATYFLGKYSHKLAKPRAVVMFGPYRFVRHPIYSSYILLFAGYCLSLRSYRSLLLLILTSIVYYSRRAQKEEVLLEENFGQLYQSYKDRVVKKFLPWVY